MIVEALTRIVRIGALQWDVKGYTGDLPPGAWMKRVRPTNTLLDHPAFAPEYIHPLEAVATYAGRFNRTEERRSIQMMTKARGTFAAACRFWGEGCGLKTSGEAARWFWLFTPVLGDPAHNFNEINAGIIQAGGLWHRLDIPGNFHDCWRQTLNATRGPTYRPNFWRIEAWKK